jgi:hypothetical protein
MRSLDLVGDMTTYAEKSQLSPTCGEKLHECSGCQARQDRGISSLRS